MIWFSRYWANRTPHRDNPSSTRSRSSTAPATAATANGVVRLVTNDADSLIELTHERHREHAGGVIRGVTGLERGHGAESTVAKSELRLPHRKLDRLAWIHPEVDAETRGNQEVNM